METKGETLKSKRLLLAPVGAAMIVCIVGCTGVAALNDSTENERQQIRPDVFSLQGRANESKNIFVFLDGTKNTKNSQTNVWRLFDAIAVNNDPQTTAAYISGVGSADDAPLSGAALGKGMQERVLAGYRFVANNYRPNDRIFLFGFSRGAHQARALAGLISYAGFPPIPNEKDEEWLAKVSNDIIELVKKESDVSHENSWVSWRPGQPPLLSRTIKDKLGIAMQPAEIAFLGVWDTVPGSSLKDYGECKENRGFVKNYLYWLIPGIDKGERYKTDSYPPIRRIVHAVALDEKRSKFAPLLLCDAISPPYTETIEAWFPGAHADIGGGYEDERELPDISLEWMIGLLSASYELTNTAVVKGNAAGLAHWSIGDGPANLGSHCIDRRPPPGASIHPSVDERRDASPVPVLWKGIRKNFDYPIDCQFFPLP